MRIESIRLAHILKSLSTRKNSTTEERAASQQVIHKNDATNVRDPDVLKMRMANKLRTLKRGSAHFIEEAPLVTIQEIMTWEFGDQFLNHPDFKHITQSIVTAIGCSPKLSRHLNSLIKNLTQDDD